MSSQGSVGSHGTKRSRQVDEKNNDTSNHNSTHSERRSSVRGSPQSVNRGSSSKRAKVNNSETQCNNLLTPFGRSPNSALNWLPQSEATAKSSQTTPRSTSSIVSRSKLKTRSIRHNLTRLFKEAMSTRLPVVIEGEPMSLANVLDNWPTVIKHMDPSHDLGRLDVSSSEPSKYKDVFRHSSVPELIAKTLVGAESIVSGHKDLNKKTFHTNADLDKYIDKLRKATKSPSFEHTFLNTTRRLGEEGKLLKVETLPNTKLASTYKNYVTFSEARAEFPKELATLPKLRLASSELDPAVCEPHMSGTVRSGRHKPKGAAMSIIFDKKNQTLRQVVESEQGKSYEFHSSLSNALVSGAVGGIHRRLVKEVRRNLANDDELCRMKKQYEEAIISHKQGVSVTSLKKQRATKGYEQKKNEMSDNSAGEENYLEECNKRDRENARTLANLVIDCIRDELTENSEQNNSDITEKIIKKVLEYKSDGDYRQAADCVEVAGTRPVLARSIDSMCSANMIAIALREDTPLSVILESGKTHTTVATTNGERDSKKPINALFWTSGVKKGSSNKKGRGTKKGHGAKKQKRKTRRN